MCINPMLGIPCGKTSNNKIKYEIHNKKDFVNKYYKNGEISQEYLFKINGLSSVKDFMSNTVDIPCGKCVECRLNYARQWANRCMFELQLHESSFFVTLTYNDESINKYNKIEYCNQNGEKKESYTLIKKDFQLFMKRLRDAVYPKKLKYYMCGEYGSKSFRPHYHAIIFGLELNDLVFYKMSDIQQPLYTSNFLNSKWFKDETDKSSLGYVVVGSVTPQSCAYVARYVNKKAFRDMKTFYKETHVLPEYTNMSLKPAIGKDWFEQNQPDLLHSEGEYFSTTEGGIKVSYPRYFRKLYEKQFPDEYLQLKERNEKDVIINMISSLDQSSLPDDQYFSSKETNIIERTSSLVRDL